MWKNICTLLLAFALFSCEEQADLSNSQAYTKDGVSFTLPGNWTVVEDIVEENFRYISIESSGDAVAGISLFYNGVRIELEDYIDLIIESFNDELPVGSRNRGEVFEFTPDNTENIARAIRNQFAITLASVEVPHTSDFYEMKTDRDYVIIFTQVSDQDKHLVQQGFDQLINSFVVD
ncbi:hypothetical protein WH96_05740 [Kiloniella spongiae]|uniref:PsbP C-terminal domain-containing protein n=1 Tax=Kiloniella spongiae TaxID=1489064 RepID=A0A0H2MGS2_9PROT|nr:hypothetical protein [Kiloniella spongiae]KLN61794.1 hypothetical protein WH96_05740 [Kiloniella spongiae]